MNVFDHSQSPQQAKVMTVMTLTKMQKQMHLLQKNTTPAWTMHMIKFGNVYEVNWYKQFLYSTTQERTYHRSSGDQYGEF